MPKLGMAPIRRRQMITATYEVLYRHGYDALTLKRVAEEVGVATSMVTHYFGTKEKLILETMSDLVAGFLREVKERRSEAGSTVDEIVAIVDANFAPSQVSKSAVAAWLHFWSRVPYEPSYKRIQRICDYQLDKYLRTSLRQIVSHEQASQISDTVISLSYGCWLQFAHYEDDFDVSRAHRLALQVIEARLQLAWQQNLDLLMRSKLVPPTA